MKCNQDLFETLFQTAQKPLVMECSQALEAIRFSLPIDWTVQQQSESLLYLLPSEGESSLSVQSVIPESTDITDFESVSVLHAFADGMREQLENYAYTELCDYEGVFDAEQPIYGMRYTVTVNDLEMTTVTLLFLVEHRIYCLSFSDALQTELFPYAESFLENLMISE
mgnify:FL=1